MIALSRPPPPPRDLAAMTMVEEGHVVLLKMRGSILGTLDTSPKVLEEQLTHALAPSIVSTAVELHSGIFNLLAPNLRALKAHAWLLGEAIDSNSQAARNSVRRSLGVLCRGCNCCVVHLDESLPDAAQR